MEVYSPVTENVFEDRSDGSATVVNKRRNQENLRRSIEAHKNRLAIARMKKGKNLPGDDLTKSDNSGCCRQSTADTNENYEPYRFRRHTQSSLSKIARPAAKYTTLSQSDSFDRTFEHEQLYIKRYDDFGARTGQSMVKYGPEYDPAVARNSYNLAENFKNTKIELDSDELEKKIVEVLGKLLLRKEVGHDVEPLSQHPRAWDQKMNQGAGYEAKDNHDQMVDILTKCISTTLNTASNDVFDNLSSSRTSKSVNVEINLNMPPSKTHDQPLTVNVQNNVEEVGDVFIENVFNRDTKIVEGSVFKRAYNKFKSFYSPHPRKPVEPRQSTWIVKHRAMSVDLKGNSKGWDSKTTENQTLWGEKKHINQPRVGTTVLNQPQMGWNEVGQGKVNVPQKWVGVKPHRNEGDVSKWGNVPTAQVSDRGTVGVSCFRPFSRSRSQSIQFQNKVGKINPTLKRQAPIQTPPPWVNMQMPVKTPVSVPMNVRQQTGTLKVPLDSEQETFDPFNLKATFNKGNATKGCDNQQPTGNVWAESKPAVNRNDTFNRFTRRVCSIRNRVDEAGGLVDNNRANFTERIERRGVNCLDTFGKIRQVTRPKLMRTYNMNKSAWKEPGQVSPSQLSRISVAPPTPVMIPGAKRVNTEGRVYNRSATEGTTALWQKQLTGSANFAPNHPGAKLKLLNTRSVVNTLDRFAKINTMG